MEKLFLWIGAIAGFLFGIGAAADSPDTNPFVMGIVFGGIGAALGAGVARAVSVALKIVFMVVSVFLLFVRFN
ncbi:MAG: hypothetical protein R3D89_01760 [Sphingomonadaceae bacterium]